MMGVYIKGMEMPKGCKDCALFRADSAGFYGCFGTMNIIIFEKDEVKPKWCPLVEIPPHGRLIDADALLESIKEARKKDPEIEDVYIDDYFMVAEWVVSAPTIIEAGG